MKKLKQNQNKMLDKLEDIFKVLADVTRIQIILALAEQSRSVNALVEIVGTSQSNVSHQLRLLKNKNLVIAERKGKKIYYSVTCQHLVNTLDNLLAHIGHEGKD
ncbi:MAG: ArsR family transcriptional regulator [Candidatus Saganbacteria bacterium]|uniref:ArsR family transcriptional regulator n=1 Tax=Candidatus Saganbacteria bacterium TaxID=2575572 RepID=A0A833L1J3_UNCSA|nr:MAG: ArsR family transcriptional regulator [Candidatus Saganbacteria bacterium]